METCYLEISKDGYQIVRQQSETKTYQRLLILHCEQCSNEKCLQ
jgi:hypothetical protein